MAKDFQQPQPTKTERALYELAMRLEMTDRSTMSNGAFVAAVAILLNVDPEKIAKLLTSKNDELKQYSTKINEAIDKIAAEEKAKKEKEEPKTEEKSDK